MTAGYVNENGDFVRPNRPSPRAHRHPAEVTYDRLGDHFERWHDKFTGIELDAISMIRHALFMISEGER